MQNPFTTTFSKAPEYTYIDTEKAEEILENFSYERPIESLYKITGVRGSGKTVLLAKLEVKLRSEEYSRAGWIILDINPARDMLMQLASTLDNEGIGKTGSKNKSISISASILGTGGGFGYSAEKDDSLFDIAVVVDNMCFRRRVV